MLGCVGMCIIGPVLACFYFGWLPALIWIVIGSIFLGAVHDFSALMASLRHKGQSIAQVAEALNVYGGAVIMVLSGQTMGTPL